MMRYHNRQYTPNIFLIGKQLDTDTVSDVDAVFRYE